MSRKDESQRDPSISDLDSLQQRIEARREKYRPKQDKAPASAWSLGMRYGSEFFGGVLVGGALGLVLDYFAGISPWGLMAGTMFGFAAGTLNVVRAAREIGSESQDE
ncbi:AtpZ/AtpI family protein [Maricaulis sp.]|jgi:ATP synthase protein I|uniref:AtpZ/AtpI family protein n=1 Tax=Maricaulis sp. TaxID=1486257 RepID=UPI00260894E2|nr:AtpZ/AtpI family protein [Maricaulis sp.]